VVLVVAGAAVGDLRQPPHLLSQPDGASQARGTGPARGGDEGAWAAGAYEEEEAEAEAASHFDSSTASPLSEGPLDDATLAELGVMPAAGGGWARV